MREVQSTAAAVTTSRKAWERPVLKRLATEDAELRRRGTPDLTVNS
jgi:hypothetical protein